MSHSFGFRVARNTISVFIPEVCDAIFRLFSDELIQCPSTESEWKLVAKQFSEKWNFHHVLGALDGKHIALRCPPSAGSLYYNYKGFHSIVLMALVDADYKFLYVDIGASGSSSDDGVFGETELKEALEAGDIGVPGAEPLPGDGEPVPYFIIGDDAFPLKSWLMKPFQQRNMTIQEIIYNYRHSRARRVVENAFGILASRKLLGLSLLLRKLLGLLLLLRSRKIPLTEDWPGLDGSNGRSNSDVSS
ncbi:hypothetical protein FSP39_018566 [Pinctada imbricata]|uniref:DDE Tnp4 domain-containing protein n=1 Tax=Pinctada imbricata TaxID=66713 RepID=A0AA88Y191_PINIB|nr:hypothetical protein FSP39_018566 [Pinctada imbricata]